MNKIYKNVELLGEIKDPKHLVNKEYVDNLLNARLMTGVTAVILEDIGATYDSASQTLTQTAGKDFAPSGVTLEVGNEVLYSKPLDLTQAGIYEIVKLGKKAKASTATVSLGGSNTGILTVGDVSVNVTTFESGIGVGIATGSYIFSYSGTASSWQYQGSDITLATYGITLSSATENPADGDSVVISYTEAISEEKGELKRSERMSKSSQLFSGMLIPVYADDSIYQLTDDVKVFELDTTPLHFEKYAGNADGALKKYEEVIVGNDSDKVFSINHCLSSKAVNVSIYDYATGEECVFGVKIVSENAIEISSDVVLTTTDKFLVVVEG